MMSVTVGKMLKRVQTGLMAVSLITVTVMAQTVVKSAAVVDPVDSYNYIIGTTNIGSAYQFTNKSLLIEGADQVLAMGSNIIKVNIGPNYVQNGYAKEENPKIKSLVDLAELSDFNRLFHMPFKYYILWTYPFSTNAKVFPFHGKMDPVLRANEYKEMYAFTRYLLTTYSGTGKTFYLGNWEGDWHLLSGSVKREHKWEQDPNPDAPEGMIDWLTTRQKAIDDAKRDTPHKDVQVWFYVEVNLVQKSIREDKATVSSAVLPFVNPDFVSYSSYDSTDAKDMQTALPAALDYMQSKLKPKPGLPEKRVFIGEYSCYARKLNYDGALQDARMREVIAASVKWGTPLVLYWQLYENKSRNVDQPLSGNWLVDNTGKRWPVWYTYQSFDKDAREYVGSTLKTSGHVPSTKDFQAFTYKWFSSPDTRAKESAPAKP